jgi:hypothetical protein
MPRPAVILDTDGAARKSAARNRELARQVYRALTTGDDPPDIYPTTARAMVDQELVTAAQLGELGIAVAPPAARGAEPHHKAS